MTTQDLPTVPGFTTDDDLREAIYPYSPGPHLNGKYTFQERDLFALLRMVQRQAQVFQRRHTVSTIGEIDKSLTSCGLCSGSGIIPNTNNVRCTCIAGKP